MINFILDIVKKKRLKSKFKLVRKYVNMGNSHLFGNFNLILKDPIQSKIYLEVGDNTILDCNIVFESSDGFVKIGNDSYLGSSTLISRSAIFIGDNVFIAWGITIYDHDSHSLNYKHRMIDIQNQLNDYRQGNDFILNKDWTFVNSKPIKICSHAWIGMNATILKGVTIGEGAIVGAGSVVTKDVAPWTVVAGNPAKFIKELPENLRKT